MTWLKPSECRCFLCWWQNCFFMESVPWCLKPGTGGAELLWGSYTMWRIQGSFYPFTLSLVFFCFHKEILFPWCFIVGGVSYKQCFFLSFLLMIHYNDQWPYFQIEFRISKKHCIYHDIEYWSMKIFNDLWKIEHIDLWKIFWTFVVLLLCLECLS